MDDLVKELNRRHKITLSKFSPEFLFELCNYLDLLVLDSRLQKLLIQEQLNFNHPQNIWKHYQGLYTKVYEPIRIQNVNPRQYFSHFYWLNEDDKKASNLELLALYLSPGAIAIFQRNKYRNWLNEIHPRILILLNNDKILTGNKISCELNFYEDHSIINILSHSIQIAKRKKETNEHKILRYLFANLARNQQGISFQEIAEKEFNHQGYLLDPDSSRTYYSGCDEIQQKISKATKYQISDFLEYHSGDRAWVRINPKYINK